MELEGQINEAQFLRHLVEMGRDRFTGAVRLERDDLIKILYLQDGSIISASTNDPTESVDEILLRAKKISREHIQQALVKRKVDETLGDALLSSGFVTRKELRWARRHQIVAVLRSAIGEGEWHYTVVPDYVSSRSSEGTQFPVEPLLVELVVTDPDRERVDRRLSNGEVRLRKAPNFDERYPNLGLNDDADRVARLVNGTRTASEIATEAGGNGFMNLKLLAALHLLGVVEVNPKAQEQLEISFGHGADAAAPLLPGVHARPDVPQWEVESLPGVVSGDAVEGLEIAESGSIAEPGEPGDEGLSGELGVAGEPLEGFPAVDVAGAEAPEDDLGGWPGNGAGELHREEPVQFEPNEAPMPDDDRWDDATPSLDETVLPPSAPDGVVVPRPAGRWRWYVGGLVLLVGVVALGLLMKPFFTGEETGTATRETSSARPTEASTEMPVSPAVTADPGGTTESGPESAPEPSTKTAGDDREAVAEEPVPADPATPEPPAPGDALRERYDRMAGEYAVEAGSVAFTLQFEIVCETSSVSLAIREGGSKVWFIPITYQGRPCYRVFWGRYGTETEAASAAPEIPDSLRGGRPVVVSPGRVVQ